MSTSIFHLTVRQPNCPEQGLTLYSDGELWSGLHLLGKVRSSTLEKICSIAQKVNRRSLLPPSVKGFKQGPFRSLYFYEKRTGYVAEFDPKNERLELTKTERIAQKLPWAILHILEREEPFYFNAECGFFMINRAKPIEEQIDQIRRQLRAAPNPARKNALFIFLLTALYWVNPTVWYVESGGGKPLALSDGCYFNLEADLADKDGYAALPFRALIQSLLDQEKILYLGYQPTWQYWSLDAFRACFLNCRVGE